MREAEATLRSLFGEGIEVCAASPVNPPCELHPMEAAAVKNARAERRHEFAVGRMCARGALHRLVGGESIVPCGPDRAPIWPDGIVGSISHCEGLCCAVAGRNAEWAGLGVDIETDQPMPENLISWAFSASEIDACRANAINMKVLFGAKEAFYKCYFPIFRAFLGFHDIAIALQPTAKNNGRFFATIQSTGRPGAAMARAVRGAWSNDGAFIYAVAALPSGYASVARASEA